MGTDQEGFGVIIRICRSTGGRWDVLEQDRPIGSFDSREDATDFANEVTTGRAGASAIVLEEGSAGSEAVPDSSKQ